ncbi:MAG: hypothetical protein ABW208_24835 [Pyrinomonadaceae bacterium]
METRLISAQQFWDYYFRDLFLRLERAGGGYAGEVLSEPERAQPPEGLLLLDAPQVRVEVPAGVVREYDYASDGRFARLAERPASIAEAYRAVVEGTYPFRDPAPFGKQRMAELLTQARTLVPRGPGEELTLEDFEQTLRLAVEGDAPGLDQLVAALVWFVGERRERASSGVLLLVVQNSSYSPFARRRLHFTAVDAAFSALWKVNDKSCLWELLEILPYTSESGARKIVPLFGRLLSTTELLSPDLCGNAYLEPAFWAARLAPLREYADADWDRYDADALFWELRWLAALRLNRGDAGTLRRLADDEVGTVREAAWNSLGETVA